MTTREPEWSEQDVSWILALDLLRTEQEAYRCSACGGDSRICCAPDAEGQFEVPPPTRCHATTALVIRQQANKESPQPEALQWRVKKR